MEMKPDELRERIERSGVSGRQIARALGVERAQPSKWRGVKPIPEHHVPRIRELTDDPPPGPAGEAQSAKKAPRPASAFSVLRGLLKGGGNRVEARPAVVAHQEPPLAPSMTGPLHADFVQARNEASWRGDWKF
jgi:hypothetical protein